MSQSSPRSALDQLIPLVYDQLRDYAARALNRESNANSIQTTELVHETFLRLSQLRDIVFADKDELLRAAVGVMRRVLIDHARARLSKKRDKNQLFLRSPHEVLPEAVDPEPMIDLIALDEALQRLAQVDARKSEIVELKYFGGQSVEAIARTLGISQATVKRDWTLAKAWLYRELRHDSVRD